MCNSLTADAIVDRMERDAIRKIANGNYLATERYGLGDGRELRFDCVRTTCGKINTIWAIVIVGGGESDISRKIAAASISRHLSGGAK